MSCKLTIVDCNFNVLFVDSTATALYGDLLTGKNDRSNFKQICLPLSNVLSYVKKV